jgi:hypothetical protein
MAGDAGSFIDPMWSTGVAHALLDGIHTGALAEAAKSGRATESEIIDRYSMFVNERADLMHSVVKFVYRCNHLYADTPFWRARGAQERNDIGEAARLFRRLRKDPSSAYYRVTFQGLGIDDETTSLLSTTTERDTGAVHGLAGQLDSWIPSVASGVQLQRTLGLEPSGRMVKGITIESRNADYFITDAATIAALEAVDGRSTAREILNRVLQTAPQSNPMQTGIMIPTVLLGGYQQGLFDIRVLEKA